MQKLAQDLTAGEWESQDSGLDRLMLKPCTTILGSSLPGTPSYIIPGDARCPRKKPFMIRDLLRDSCMSQDVPLMASSLLPPLTVGRPYHHHFADDKTEVHRGKMIRLRLPRKSRAGFG